MEGGQAEQGRCGVSSCVPSLLPLPLGLEQLSPSFFVSFEGVFQKQPEPGKSLAKQLLCERQVGDGRWERI